MTLSNTTKYINHLSQPLDSSNECREIKRGINTVHGTLLELSWISTRNQIAWSYPSICIMRGKSSLIPFSIRILGSMSRSRNFTMDSKS